MHAPRHDVDEPQVTTESDGALVYTWPDTAVIRAAVGTKDRRGKYRVEASYKGKTINVAEVDLLTLKDRADFHIHCGTLDGEVNWLERLVWITKNLPRDKADAWAPRVVSLDQFRPERKDYHWYPNIPKGEPTFLDGDPGVGKSAVVVKIMAHLTTGQAFPSLFDDRQERDFAPRYVLLATNEDDPASTILPRVKINGGNPQMVRILEGKHNAQGQVLPITMQDLDIIAEALQQLRPALLIFDPIQSFFGPGIDMNQASETRPVLDGVRNLCKAHGCTPFYVRHNGKSQHTKAMHSGLGSIDIAANMRSVLALFEDAEHPQRRYLAQSKTNGRRAPSMQLTLTSATYDFDLDDGETITVEDVRVDWDGRSALTAEDLNARQWVQDRADTEEKSALEQARDFLRDVLKDGPILVNDVKANAKEAGMHWRTIERTKALEGIKAQRQDKTNPQSPWQWLMPAPDPGDHEEAF